MSERLSKPSCCCGATAKKPCACMKQGVKKCSKSEPKCPCYREKDGVKKAFGEGWSVLIKGENVPTTPSLWAQAKSKARSKFKVYPSAYANGWAAKWYKSKGGGWKKKGKGAKD